MWHSSAKLFANGRVWRLRKGREVLRWPRAGRAGALQRLLLLGPRLRGRLLGNSGGLGTDCLKTRANIEPRSHAWSLDDIVFLPGAVLSHTAAICQQRLEMRLQQQPSAAFGHARRCAQTRRLGNREGAQSVLSHHKARALAPWRLGLLHYTLEQMVPGT